LQTDLNRKYFGQTYWEAKKLESVEKREEIARIERMKRESAAKDIEKEQVRDANTETPNNTYAYALTNTSPTGAAVRRNGEEEDGLEILWNALGEGEGANQDKEDGRSQ